MASIALRGISKDFGTTPVLRNVSLEVADGEFLAILGASGSGKSTLLRVLAGLESADTGQVMIDGKPVEALPPKARNLAMVFQSYALYPYMTVRQNIGLPLEMRRLSAWQRLPLLGRLLPGTTAARAAIEAEVAQVAQALELGALLARRPSQLSGGQRQRVALARAMVRHPAAFLMDEPLSNLDARLRAEARAEITGLQRRLGATMLYVTHDQDEAMAMADRVAVMQHGEACRWPRRRISTMTRPAWRWRGSSGFPRSTRCRPGWRPMAPCTFPALSCPGAPRRRPAPEGLACLVQRVEHLGAEVLVHCSAEGLAVPVVTRLEPTEARSINPGALLRLLPRQALLFGADGRRLALRPMREPSLAA